MDSKLVKAGLLIITLFTVSVLIIVLAANGRILTNQGETATDIDDTDVGESIVDDNQSDVCEDGRIISADLDAWLKDETFFDEEKLGDGKYEVIDTKPVLYKVSTIDKDLRIIFLDENGEKITGRKFTINIAGLGEYSDIDRDGIIYIEDLSPGEYSLKMASIKGFAVPDNPTTATINAKIQYKAIADISYLIKSEADIDALLEDTATKDADEETSGNSAIKTMDGAVFGIDVSKYNGQIDWNKVKDEGVHFAIIRCGYRGSKTGAIVEDPMYKANIEGARAAGVDVGLYFFTQAIDEREAVEEASAVMSLAHAYKLTYPIFIDTESAGGAGRADELDVSQRTRVIKAFCETIRSGGYTAGIYASKNWYNNRLDISKLPDTNVTWLAEYADKPTYGASYQMWQYSSAGRIKGIEGRVDMNISYLDVKDNDTKQDKQKDTIEGDEDGQADSRDM